MEYYDSMKGGVQVLNPLFKGLTLYTLSTYGLNSVTALQNVFSSLKIFNFDTSQNSSTLIFQCKNKTVTRQPSPFRIRA